MCNVSNIEIVIEKPENCVSFIVDNNEYFVPVGNKVNIEEEIAQLQKELTHSQNFLVSVMKKLSNEKFIANASPQVVELERKKQSDVKTKIKALEEQIKNFNYILNKN
jgi:valyl-tRNA synthetase